LGVKVHGASSWLEDTRKGGCGKDVKTGRNKGEERRVLTRIINIYLLRRFILKSQLIWELNRVKQKNPEHSYVKFKQSKRNKVKLDRESIIFHRGIKVDQGKSRKR
jgi:hypothetical protein